MLESEERAPADLAGALTLIRDAWQMLEPPDAVIHDKAGRIKAVMDKWDRLVRIVNQGNCGEKPDRL